MPLSSKHLAGPGYVILNIIRFMNIVALLAVICASVVMVVKTVMVSQFYFFDGVSHVITTFISAFLIISELNLFRSYFNTHWPLLCPSHGLVAIGTAMIILGVNILGNLNKPAFSRNSLGYSFWQLVTASGIMIITFGFLNIVSSYVFRDTSRGISARHVRAKGAIAVVGDSSQGVNISKPATSSSGELSATHLSNRFSRWAGFTKRPSLPSYHTSPVPSSHYSARNSMESQQGLKISGQMEMDPKYDQLVRPDSSFHPSKRFVG